MDEILLTHDELMAENQKAHEVWEALHGQDGEVKWGEWWYVWLLRAQVRKVVEWMEKHDCPLMVDAESLGYVVISEEDMQALRAAAEEVK